MASAPKLLSFSNTFFFLFVFLFWTAFLPSSGEFFRRKKTHLHHYFHEKFVGPDSNDAFVAGQNKASVTFGNVLVVDNELREGPEPTSRLIGRAQGIIAQASKDQEEGSDSYFSSNNLIFMEGEYKGSTLAVHGRTLQSSRSKEFVIVGGTGQFRLAQGYIQGKQLNTSYGIIILEMDYYIIHYQGVMVSF